MTLFAGWYGLGTGLSNTGTLVEATGYTRPATSLSGTPASGQTEAVSQINSVTGPTGSSIVYGAIFDTVTKLTGNMLAYWTWPTPTAITVGHLAAITVNIVYNSYLQAQLTLSATGGQGADGSTIDQGAQIGTCCGSPMIAGCRLLIQSGTLVALPNGAAVIKSPATAIYLQIAGTNVGRVDSSGNLTLSGTVTSSGTP